MTLNPDQQPAPEPGTSGQEAGTQQGEPTFDHARAYNELRPEYTRATQRLSEYEQLFSALHDEDPETQRAAREALGIETVGSPESKQSTTRDPDEFVDPLEEEVIRLRTQVETLSSAREREAAEAEAKALEDLRDDFISEAIGFIEEETKQKFASKEEEALGNLAIAMADENGVPNVQGAYALLYGSEGVLEVNRERWVASKTGAAQPPAGTTIPADQKPATKADRINYIDERMRALDQQQ